MKPYLELSSLALLTIEWVVLAVSVLFVFSPFIYLGIRKWKKHLSLHWWHVVYSYILSVVIFPLWCWFVLGLIGEWILDSYINSGYLHEAVMEPGLTMVFIIMVAWPLLVFYSAFLLKKDKFTLKIFVYSSVVAALFFLTMLYFFPHWFFAGGIYAGCLIGKVYESEALECFSILIQLLKDMGFSSLLF